MQEFASPPSLAQNGDEIVIPLVPRWGERPPVLHRMNYTPKQGHKRLRVKAEGTNNPGPKRKKRSQKILKNQSHLAVRILVQRRADAVQFVDWVREGKQFRQELPDFLGSEQSIPILQHTERKLSGADPPCGQIAAPNSMQLERRRYWPATRDSSVNSSLAHLVHLVKCLLDGMAQGRRIVGTR